MEKFNKFLITVWARHPIFMKLLLKLILPMTHRSSTKIFFHDHPLNCYTRKQPFLAIFRRASFASEAYCRSGWPPKFFFWCGCSGHIYILITQDSWTQLNVCGSASNFALVNGEIFRFRSEQIFPLGPIKHLGEILCIFATRQNGWMDSSKF